MASIFTRIINGEIPGRIVWEDDLSVVMIDIRPLRRGHCLVVPKEEVDDWVDLDVGLAAHLMTVASTVAKVQSQIFDGERIGLMIAGFEVPHAHIHISPADSMADFDFANAHRDPGDAELDEVADALRAALRSAGHESSVPS